jgi:7-carboxy-7-deazaguanine synthase
VLLEWEAMTEALVVNEIFLSLQGESTWAGLPCVFVRLAGCNLRCSWCDTAYAFAEGRRLGRSEVVAEVARLAGPYRAGRGGRPLPLVEVTGGEPLLQSACLPLLTALCDEGYTVLLETSGALEIAAVDPRVHRIMDLKCPGSGESHRNCPGNLLQLKSTDEVKFVVASQEDYEWARGQLAERRLASLCPVLFSWAEPLTPEQRNPSLKPTPPGHHPISRQELAERILADALPVRMQAQLHKIIWPPSARGV